ncbi:MAG: FtsX-like permease family protein, partial [Spirochaetales bacterium]|nr:FtsX-like permease family protein [Spirochaetales bacterium]
NTSVPPVLPHYQALSSYVASLPGVASWTSQVSGFGFVNLGSHGQAFTLLFGVHPSQYFSTFHSLKIVEGSLLKDGEPGIMMSRHRLDEIAKDNHVHLKVGDKILINSFSKAGLKIRSVPLVGVYEYTIPTQALEVLSYVDAETLRALNALSLGTIAPAKLPPKINSLLNASSDNAFFSDAANGPLPSLGSALSSSSSNESAPAITTPEVWNDLMIRLKPGVAPGPVIAALNAEFAKRGWDVQAVDWKAAAGTTAKLTGVTQVVFNALLIILSIVAVIIILNTLVISVMERTPEIGTMRALGASKGFIRQLFIAETMITALVFGLLGILLGSGLVLLLGAVGIEINNDFLQILFGARDLRPLLSWNQVGMAVALTLGIGLVSWIYPVAVALRVTPLAAITSD